MASLSTRLARRLLLPAIVATGTFLYACSDITTPHATRVDVARPATLLNLAAYIDQQIGLLYDKGFATSVQARWNTIKSKKSSNFAVAQKDFANLADWIDKKTSSLKPPADETQDAAAVRLTLNMSNWLYGTGTTPPVEDVGEDVTVEVIPQGEPAQVVVPSDHAGVAFGPQNEARVVIISESEYPGNCNGPLATSRCQYPLFYRITIQPDVKIIGHGRFAVCMHTEGDRRPLEYPEDEPNGPVHERMRLAHDLPANPADYTDGSTREEGIEILPLAPTQQNFVHCDEHSHLGMNSLQKAMHAAMHFAGRIVSPKDAYAYDQGPEHIADFASNFNAVDPLSQPDVAVASVTGPPSEAFPGDALTVTYTVENRSRRMGGNATATSRATTAQLKLFDSDGNAVRTLGAVDNVLAMQPDAAPQSFTQTVAVPTDIALDRSYYVGAVVGNAGVFDEVGMANNTGKAAATLVKNPEVPIALNLASFEKLPNGTQHLFVTSGSPGPYSWSVNGTDGGSSSFGTIVTNADFSADYTAPAAVPTPPTFDVCARRTASPSNQACATVTIKPVPSSGADVIVFNDLNMFDNTAASNANNLTLYRNLVNFTTTGSRGAGTAVWIHDGHAGDCATWGCGWNSFISTMSGQGYTVTRVNDATGPLTAIPASVKVLVLALPRAAYSAAEINAMKQFAGEGGRIVFVGEWDGYYGVSGLSVENDFLTKMGAVMRNTGGAIDCGFVVLPGSSLRPHQVTTGLTNLTIACASVVQLGPNDYALFYDRANSRVLGAVAKVDLTPLPIANLLAASVLASPGASDLESLSPEERQRRSAYGDEPATPSEARVALPKPQKAPVVKPKQ